MSNKYKFRNPEGVYFISTTTVYWLDVFTRRAYKDIIIDSLNYSKKEKGLIIYAYVIMSNHIHLMIGKSNDDISFSEIMRDFKKFTSMNIIKAIKENPGESRREWLLWMMERAGGKNRNNSSGASVRLCSI